MVLNYILVGAPDVRGRRCFQNVGILFSLSTLVPLYVGILFGLSTLVRLVRQCSMYVGIFFGSWYVSTLSTAMFSCILVFYSVLVR